MNVRVSGHVSTGRKAVWIGLLIVFSAILFTIGWYRMFLSTEPPLVEALLFNAGAAVVMWGIIVIAVRPRLSFPWSLVVLLVAGSAAILYGWWHTGAVLEGAALENPARQMAIEAAARETAYVNASRVSESR
jgi:hypothetical protein